MPIREGRHLSGFEMLNPQPAGSIEMSLVREIALRKLRQMVREQPIQECYLIKEEHFAGVRYNAGSISFLWNVQDQYASIQRGELLIETVNLVGGQETRRAA